ncbi:hypothetical protein CONLIGDRAFT_686734 [Coniochaeta ligniaria NRRL 30616]|uniref:Uncharacterized protein n=1 Tax=Coniochaeta ligniaria NRRL 30616 TaxID=1408157 RepID=A0A1J7J0A0_9PEZI|nr:hypothetical protein CONLIGDRAFT_686734 [Coniochaeta ligniaria NRRL 30616]
MKGDGLRKQSLCVMDALAALDLWQTRSLSRGVEQERRYLIMMKHPNSTLGTTDRAAAPSQPAVLLSICAPQRSLNTDNPQRSRSHPAADTHASTVQVALRRTQQPRQTQLTMASTQTPTTAKHSGWCHRHSSSVATGTSAANTKGIIRARLSGGYQGVFVQGDANDEEIGMLGRLARRDGQPFVLIHQVADFQSTRGICQLVNYTFYHDCSTWTLRFTQFQSIGR